MEQNLVIKLKGLDCPHCAQKIEDDARSMKELNDASVNLIRQELTAKINEGEKENALLKIKEIVHKYEPDVEVFVPTDKKQYTIILKGLDCPHCGAEIENGVNKLPEVETASVNLLKQQMEVVFQNEAKKQSAFEKIKQIVAAHEPNVTVSFLSEENKNTYEQEDFSKILKKRIALYIVGFLLFLSAALGPFDTIIKTALFLASYMIYGFGVLKNAVKNIKKGQIFDENFLMSVSTLGAIAIGELSEAVFVMLFYQIGETFQQAAVNNSRKSIQKLMDIRPDYADLKTEKGVKRVSPEEVSVGDTIVIKPGEKIPLDGIVTQGRGQLDTSVLTGESMPQTIKEGDEVFSGSINLNSVLEIKVTKEFGKSTVFKILELVENASAKKSKAEQFITKFARIYTPIVVMAALILAFVPPMFTPEKDLAMWIGRALIFLVISCPCALVLSVPLGFFSGIGEASKHGILVKGSNYMHALGNTGIVVFDKTGTLTKGAFEVTEIKPQKGFLEEEIIYYAACAEKMSNHPIGQSILNFYKKQNNHNKISESIDITEHSGYGIEAVSQGKKILAGNHKFMEKENVAHEIYDGIGSVVYIAVDGVFAGYIVVSDQPKDTSKKAIARLKKLGVKKTVMLTGDNRKTAEKVSHDLGLDEFYGELLPQNKVEIFESISDLKQKSNILFVGDGINDAPVLARADIGVAMGGVGSDAAIEAADVVIMNDDLCKIADGIIIARNTNKIVNQNIVFALFIKVIVLALGAFGIATMWMAVFADVGVTFIAILNATRKKI